MIRARRVVLVGILGGVLVGLTLLGGAPRDRADEDDSNAPAPASTARPDDRLEGFERTQERLRSTAASQGSATRELLGREALIELLEHIQAAYVSEDYGELERLLSALLENPEQLRALVDGLASAGTNLGAEAVRGAILALEAGIALYERDTSRFGSAGKETIVQILDLLPTFGEDLQAPVIRMLQRVRGVSGKALDERFLSQLLELRSRHPEQAEVFVPLLGVLAEGELGPEQRESFRRLFLDGEDDPLLVKCALSSLLSEDPGAYLPVAKELHARNPEDFDLRGAIAQSIASSAPLAEATQALATITDGKDYSAFMTLASRPGAADVIAEAYDALLADGANPDARKLLVSAMREESEEVLLGIARMDPDPTVGLQAALSLTIRGPIGAQRLAEVRGLFETGRQHPSGAAMVAENVMVHSSGEVRDSARDWLIDLVRDPSLTDSVRSSAFARVRRWVPAGTFAGTQIGGRAIE